MTLPDTGTADWPGLNSAREEVSRTYCGAKIENLLPKLCGFVGHGSAS